MSGAELLAALRDRVPGGNFVVEYDHDRQAVTISGRGPRIGVRAGVGEEYIVRQPHPGAAMADSARTIVEEMQRTATHEYGLDSYVADERDDAADKALRAAMQVITDMVAEIDDRAESLFGPAQHDAERRESLMAARAKIGRIES